MKNDNNNNDRNKNKNNISKDEKIRPVGITVLAILAVLLGILSILAGIGTSWVGGFVDYDQLSADLTQEEITELNQSFMGLNYDVYMKLIGSLYILFGLAQFAICFGFLNGNLWAKYLFLTLVGLVLTWSLYSFIMANYFALFSVALHSFFIYYIGFSKKVKSFF